MEIPWVPEDIFGWCGGLVALIYNIPQIHRNYVTKSVEDLSEISILLRMVSYILYIIHVWIKNDAAVFYSYVFSFLQLIVLLTQVRWYKRLRTRTNG